MTIDQLAPAQYPAREAEVTVDGLADAFQDAAQWHALEGSGDATATAMDGLAFLLRALKVLAPEGAERVALDLWRRTQEGPPEGWPAHELAERFATHAQCLDRAADDPDAASDPRVQARLRVMADAARAGATAALAHEPGVGKTDMGAA